MKFISSRRWRFFLFFAITQSWVSVGCHCEESQESHLNNILLLIKSSNLFKLHFWHFLALLNAAFKISFCIQQFQKKICFIVTIFLLLVLKKPVYTCMWLHLTSKENLLSMQIISLKASLSTSNYIHNGCSKWHMAVLLWSIELHSAAFMLCNPK